MYKMGKKANMNKEKEKEKENEKEKELISFDELYKSYKSYCQAKNIVDKHVLPMVSKHFFEKCLLHELTTFIKFDKFVSSEWLQT